MLGWAAGRSLDLGGDLRKFMPAPRTPAQHLLMDELGEGPGARLLLLSIEGADAATLAAQSRALATKLRTTPGIALAANGDADLSAIPERLRPYRYLLSDGPSAGGLGSAALADQLQQRVADLGSPMASVIEPVIERDPTLEMLKLAERWQPAASPQKIEGVWFTRDGRRALLAVQTGAAGFDPKGQETALASIRTAFDAVRAKSPTRLVLTGPGAFAVEVAGRTQHEAGLIGMVDSICFVLLLWVAYRSWKAPLLGGLPLATAGLTGLAAVAFCFDGVHGITVAFGFTLIGVAQDYPIHLFSHQRPGVSPWASAKALWPTLGTGVASTCIAYMTFLVSGVEGLRQLAVFTVVGLGSAALAARFLLPALIDPAPHDLADSPRLRRWWARIERWPRLGVVPGLLLAGLLLAALAFAPGAFWQNDLSKLTPIPADALARDSALRSELGAPDVRYLVTVDARDVESALQASERLIPALDDLRAKGAIAGYDLAARYVPSAATQRARQSRLPTADVLRHDLDAAVAASPFLPDAFEGFIEDVATARTAKPLTPRDLAGTPLASGVEGLLLPRADGATALVTLTGLTDPAVVAHALQGSGAQLMDLKEASESLVAAYRGRVLWALALAGVLLIATVFVALRSPRRVMRVLAPMALTTLLILAVLRLAGVELNLFHLVALILAAGLGLDYALFFDHAGDDPEEQVRALHAIIVCSLTTLIVFLLLGLSSIPVLRAIGLPVALGVAANFVLALLIVRHDSAPVSAAAAETPV
ncbi:MMPL family transporter [Cognatilysobacter lacus]|uniref:MMPL family transporter n=1 Tax=Cognatilysobacter lacus TaxID=1643323 RepID=A0A5D8Z0A6_9GAMM|nr:MMPL family transporter [Lysobacter lacus]TZF87956.1 MMPL family transporter [Lysobacter lacus]